MEDALNQVRKFAAQGDHGRREAVLALRDLLFSLETPHDTMHRYGHMVCFTPMTEQGRKLTIAQNLQAAIVQVGIDLKWFRYLAESSVPLTVDQISTKTGAEPQLTHRLLRFLASIGAVNEEGKDQYAANQVTRNLTDKLVEAALSHYFGTAARQYQALPGYFKKNGYKDPVDDANCPFQVAHDTALSQYAWFAANPTQLAHFNTYMALRRKPDTTWLSVYPVAEHVANWSAEKSLFVNIGGGIGHQCAQFIDKFPKLPGRIVLQDLPQSVAQALPTPGVENMAHDMFKPQPVLGAKFYYLRGVLHNHPPHKVRLLLENIKSAMRPESILLVDEIVLPETQVSYIAASLDLTMLSAFASMERTEAQWRETFESVGLELVRTYTYYPQGYESVMDLRLPRTKPSSS
ncbi:hypothetical protein CDD82_4304 [Ophiocordyceps australis]|uniref:Uncharacterized protein n=1 Tax=Ophiocordyceps australis TaxID=1399860 RepID=A0A2C5YCD7_9HYPO|nr:hypothetical protein CDD82_4304 [Ophiocordyceps australis]